MTDERGLVELERVKNLLNVIDERFDRILARAQRLAREWIAAN